MPPTSSVRYFRCPLRENDSFYHLLESTNLRHRLLATVQLSAQFAPAFLATMAGVQRRSVCLTVPAQFASWFLSALTNNAAQFASWFLLSLPHGSCQH